MILASGIVQAATRNEALRQRIQKSFAELEQVI